ncbi:hypothetical protein ACFQ2K_05615 [Streptomyces sanglieri]|uniref:Uncharacterized protein n=1 Tax=Streptomyces sanglieri TaxID=193460 RepID=A0ABW2WJT8_9ACTN
MKLATVEHDRAERTALVLDQGERLLLLDRAHRLVTGEHAPALTTMQTIIDGGEPVRQTLERLAAQAPPKRSSPHPSCAGSPRCPGPYRSGTSAVSWITSATPAPGSRASRPTRSNCPPSCSNALCTT